MARRSGLGRGLGALIPGSEATTGSVSPGSSNDVPAESPPSGELDLRTSQAFRTVPINSIRPNTYQPRKNLDQAELEPLAASIKELGVLQPILVRADGPDSWELIAGERRWRASQVAGLTEIPVIVKDSDNETSLQQALVENLHRRDLNPLDEAAAYQQLIDDFSMTHEQVAKRVGRSRVAVSNHLRLLQLQPKIQKLMLEEKISEGHAKAMLAIDDAAFQLQLAERVSREQLSVRAVEEAARMRKEIAKAVPSAAPAKAVPASEGPSRANAAALEWQSRLSDSLDTRVTVDVAGKRGRIVIEFADLDDLDRVSSTIVGMSTSS